MPQVLAQQQMPMVSEMLSFSEFLLRESVQRKKPKKKPLADMLMVKFSYYPFKVKWYI